MMTWRRDVDGVGGGGGSGDDWRTSERRGWNDSQFQKLMKVPDRRMAHTPR